MGIDGRKVVLKIAEDVEGRDAKSAIVQVSRRDEVMAIRPVRIYGDPVLRTKAVPVTAFDDSLRELVADMHETMKAYKGVGLAANQVGVTQRVFVIDVPDGRGACA